MIYQRMLKWSGSSNLTITYEEKKLQAKYIFPFFNWWLRVVMVMVETTDKKSLFFKPAYFQHKSATNHAFISYQPLKEITSTSLSTLLKKAYHFDPWWILQEGTDISTDLKEAVKRTNIAERKLKGKRIVDVSFNDSLTLLEGIKVKRGLLISELINQNRLFPLAFEK